MRFAAIFASVLSLGFLAAAAPVASIAALATRDVDLAVRAENAVTARCLTGGCSTEPSGGSGDLVSVATNFHAQITVSLNALMNACNQPGVTAAEIVPLLENLQVVISATVDAFVKANVSILGIVSVTVDIGAFVQVCVGIIVDIITCLHFCLTSCGGAQVQVAACVSALLQLIIKANACVPGCGQQIVAGLQAYVQVCIDIGLNLSAIVF